MIENIYKGKKLLTCDNCGGGQEFDSWDDTLEYMRMERWLIRRMDGEWTHYCPECRLTERDEYGNTDIISVDSAEIQLNLEFDELNRVTEALNRLAGYEDTGLTPERIQAQQQEIRLLSMEIVELREAIQALKAYADNADTDKDEQAGRIMRLEDGIKKAKQMFKNIEIITSCPETGNERNAMQMAINGHRLMVALLGGKEDA